MVHKLWDHLLLWPAMWDETPLPLGCLTFLFACLVFVEIRYRQGLAQQCLFVGLLVHINMLGSGPWSKSCFLSWKLWTKFSPLIIQVVGIYGNYWHLMQGVLHWVAQPSLGVNPLKVEVRLFDKLFLSKVCYSHFSAFFCWQSHNCAHDFFLIASESC